MGGSIKMKILRYVAGFLCAGLLFSAVALAQDNATPQKPKPANPSAKQIHVETPDVRLNNISKRVTLTDEQKEKMKPILQSQYDQITAVLKDTSLAQDEQRKKVQEIRKSIRPQIMGLLTPEQKKQWHEMEQQQNQPKAK
jgi:Spy/CpxP family protein refolding chaperone